MRKIKQKGLILCSKIDGISGMRSKKTLFREKRNAWHSPRWQEKNVIFSNKDNKNGRIALKNVKNAKKMTLAVTFSKINCLYRYEI